MSKQSLKTTATPPRMSYMLSPGRQYPSASISFGSCWKLPVTCTMHRVSCCAPGLHAGAILWDARMTTLSNRCYKKHCSTRQLWRRLAIMKIAKTRWAVDDKRSRTNKGFGPLYWVRGQWMEYGGTGWNQDCSTSIDLGSRWEFRDSYNYELWTHMSVVVTWPIWIGIK